MKGLGPLKMLVNNPTTWEAFTEYLNHHINNSHLTMENSSDLPAIYREQGRVMILKKLLRLREEVNKLDGRQTSLFE